MHNNDHKTLWHSLLIFCVHIVENFNFLFHFFSSLPKLFFKELKGQNMRNYVEKLKFIPWTKITEHAKWQHRCCKILFYSRNKPGTVSAFFFKKKNIYASLIDILNDTISTFHKLMLFFPNIFDLNKWTSYFFIYNI